jgi:hypothetical protein
MPVEQQPPDVLAMVLADSILRDVVTGKFFIQGTYSVIVAHHFPHTHPSIVAYVAITSGHGQTPIRLRLVDAEDSRDPIFESDLVFNFADPLVVAEMVIGAPNVVFPDAGEHRLQLFGAGQLLLERRIQVVPAQQPPPES